MARTAAGSILVCAVEGSSLTNEESSFFREIAPSGITIFGRNCSSQPALKELVNSLQTTREPGTPPLVIAIDQEGGRVARLKAPFPNAGPAMLMAGGRLDPQACAEIASTARNMGLGLLELGINVNFAPVCDVLTEPSNTSIGDRAFAVTAEGVVARAGSFLDGLQGAGVLGCLKHFPGQGAATVDTHLGAAIVGLNRDELELHLRPFRALLPRAPMVMISHCIYPVLAEGEASSSPEVITGLLKRDLGFSGVVVSDDMNMGAVPQEQEAWQEAIVRAVNAGVDMILVCRHLERYQLAYEALSREAERSSAFRQRLSDAAARVTQLRYKLAIKN